MKKQQNLQTWGPGSLSFWLTLVIAVGITFIGLRYMISPFAASIGFGLPLPAGNTALYGSIKGIRDIFSGLVLGYLLWLRNPRITAVIFTAAIIIPICDCLVVYTANGAADWPHMLIHGGTALYAIVTSILLFRQPINTIV